MRNMKDKIIYIVWVAVLSLTTVLGNAQTVVIKELNTAETETRNLYSVATPDRQLSKEGYSYANRNKKSKEVEKNMIESYFFNYKF